MSESISASAMLEPPPRLRVVSARLDGLGRPAAGQPAKDRLDLFGEGPAWRRAELELELVADAAAARAFERRHGALAAVVVARCAATRARQSARLERSRRSRSSWRGALELDRANYGGRILLGPRLVVAGGDAPRLAAEAEAYEVYVDEPAGLDFAGGLRLRWRDFRAADADPLARQFANVTHVVSFGAGDEPPEVWLNESFEGLRGLLEGGERDERRRAEHDLVRTDIARSVWSELLNAAMAAVRAEDDGGEARAEWPGAEWQREVLRRVLPRVAPGRSLHELLELAAGEWREYPGACEFQARAGAVIGEIVRADEAVRRLVQASEEEGS
jgi:hypothetical protein